MNPSQPRPLAAFAVLLTFPILGCICPLAAEEGDSGAALPAERAAWTTSRITGSLETPPPYRAERVAPELKFDRPVEIVPAPSQRGMFFLELEGKILYVPDLAAETPAPLLFGDLKKEAPELYRAYGLTFHPDFPRRRECFVCYVLEQGIADGTRLSRFDVEDSDPPRLAAGSEEILLTWPSGGHNGGAIRFGPDGFLYVSAGDGAGAFPPDDQHTGQNVGDLRATVMRIDVDHPAGGRPYSIPSDNPFVDVSGARGEVWAFGFRNPWKMSFDPSGGDLWVGDVGWELWEMVYRVERGANYGWSLVEGRQPVHNERQRGPAPISPPTIEHSHTEARSITGGEVYHGDRLPELKGAYVYGDYVTGKIWGAHQKAGRVTEVVELADTSIEIIAFGTTHERELLILDHAGGVYRLERNDTAQANAEFPRRLSETGLFASVFDHAPAAGVLPYEINAEMWHDGATAQRMVALPGRSQLGRHDSSNLQVGYIQGEWKFPIDSVLAKTISLEMTPGEPASRRRLETQILHRHGDAWQGYTYIWNDEQTDATLAPAEGSRRTFKIEDGAGAARSFSWRFAARSECILCHVTRAGSVLAFNPSQLDREGNFGETRFNQLRAFEQLGLLEQPVAEHEVMPDPREDAAPVEARARAYLHVNCAHCHRRGGGGTAMFDIRYEEKLEKTGLLGARPTQGAFGILAAQVAATGDPYRSVLYYRMAKLGRGRMPYFGSSAVDEAGLALIHDWLASLPADGPRVAAVDSLRSRQAQALRNIAEGAGSEAGPAVGALLSTPSGALQLLRAIDSGRVQGGVAETAIAAATADSDPTIRDLFERFVPEEKRMKRLGETIDSAEILALTGSAERGRRLFFETAGVQCKNCHKIGDAGAALGPDLSEIGKKLDRAKLLESLVEPGKNIDEKYVVHLVETNDGRVVSGLLVERTERELVLLTAENKELRIPQDAIEFTAPQRASLMPDLLLRDMTAQDVADLLEFLGERK